MHSKALCTYTILFGGYGARSMDNQVRADFIPQPSPKVKWKIASGENQFEFVLKDKVLEGVITGRDNLGPPAFPVTIRMDKFISILAPPSSLPKKIAVFSGKWVGTWSNGPITIMVVEQIQDTWAEVVWAQIGRYPVGMGNLYLPAGRYRFKVLPGSKPQIYLLLNNPNSPDSVFFEVQDSNTLEGTVVKRNWDGRILRNNVIMKRAN